MVIHSNFYISFINLQVAAATFVAADRHEDLGESVGYTIEMDMICGVTSNLVFCSSNVFIRNLFLPDGLLNISHVIIDEAHERDMHSDLIITYLKHILGYYDLKIILMSADSSTIKFRNYFETAGVADFGKTVSDTETIYIDEMLSKLNYNSLIMNNFQKPRKPYSICSSADVALEDYQNFCINYDYLLHYEEATTHLQILFVREGIPVDYQHSVTGMTALMIAVELNDLTFISRLFYMGK